MVGDAAFFALQKLAALTTFEEADSIRPYSARDVRAFAQGTGQFWSIIVSQGVVAGNFVEEKVGMRAPHIHRVSLLRHTPVSTHYSSILA